MALPAVQALADSHHDLVAVVTRPDAAAGRGRRTVRSPVAAWADEAGIEVRTPNRPADPDFLDWLTATAPDCCPVVAYGALVPPKALAIPRDGWLNLHFSLLPAWRGAAPVQHAIWHGDAVTGASVFRLEAGMDTGPVYDTLTEPIGSADTAGDMLDRLAISGAKLLVDVLDAMEAGTANAVVQPTEGVSLAPKIDTADAAVDWAEPAAAVDRRIRACTPAPGAWTLFRGDRIKLAPVRPTELTESPEADRPRPGELVVAKREVLVGTATEPIRLTDVQPPGKRPMPAVDWARGVRPTDRERLG